MPVSVYSHIYSNEEEGFKSENIEVLKGLDSIKEHFGNTGTYALDRGFDNNLFYKYFTNNQQQFVIRAKNNRNVIYKGRRMNILEVANLYKGK